MSSIRNCRKVPITDVLSFIVDNRGKTVPTAEKGIPLIATNCVLNEHLYPTFEKIRFVSEEVYNSWFRAYLEPNDILFVNKGTPGRCCLVPNPVSFCAAQDMIGLRCDPSKVYYRYLLMALRSPSTQKFINNYHVGIAIPHFKKEDLPNLEIPLPDMEEQIKLGDLYFDLCNMIEHNNTISAELEGLAKTIYDYWFLQFEFPNEEGKPYKSSGGKMVYNEELKREIPEEWNVVDFSKIGEFIKGKIPNNDLTERPEGESNSPYITIDVANNSRPLYCNPDKMVPVNGETIMVMDGAASGDVYVGNYGTLGSTFSKISPVREDISDSLIYVLLKQNSIIYKRANTGSTVPHANPGFIKQMKFVLPKNCASISRQFDTYYKQIETLREQNQQLGSLRDWLLPMLMNGQVSFKEKA